MDLPAENSSVLPFLYRLSPRLATASSRLTNASSPDIAESTTFLSSLAALSAFSPMLSISSAASAVSPFRPFMVCAARSDSLRTPSNVWCALSSIFFNVEDLLTVEPGDLAGGHHLLYLVLERVDVLAGLLGAAFDVVGYRTAVLTVELGEFLLRTVISEFPA